MKNENILTNPNPEIWDKVAMAYSNQIDDPEVEIASELVSLFKQLHIPDDAKILELGCGSGHLSGLLSKEGYTVSLLDFSEQALEKAKGFFETHKMQGQFIKQDLFHLSIREDYDVLWNSGVMEHFNDTELLKLLKTIGTKTKKYFIFMVPNPDSLPYLLFRYHLISENQWEYGKEYLRKDYKWFLEEAGFNLVQEGYIGAKLTKYLFTVGNNQGNYETYFNEMSDNNLLPEKEKYLKVYVATVNNKEVEKEQKEALLKTEKFTDKFDYTCQINGLKREVQHLKDENDSLKIQHQTSNVEQETNIKCQEKIEYLEKEHSQLIIRIKRLQAQKQKLKADKKSLIKTNETLEKQLHEIRVMKDTAERENRQLNDKNNQIYEEKRELKEKINKEKEQIIKLEANIKLLKKEKNEQIDKLTKETIDKTQQLEHVKHHLDLIHRSDFWKVATRYYRIRDNIWPINKLYNYIKQHKLKRQNIQTVKKPQTNIYTEGKNIIEKSTVDILYFSIIDYHFRYQRPQHLASNLASKGKRVFYFNANFNPEQEKIEAINENLQIITLQHKIIHRIYDIDFDKDMKEIYTRIDQFIFEKDIKDAAIVVNYPNWQPIAQYLKDKFGFKIIFDYLDDFAGFNTNNDTLLNFNNKLFAISDKVIATSQYLYERAIEKTKETDIIRNGTEYEHFHKAYQTNDLQKERPVIGYYGAIAEWFDIEKIVYIADSKPEWDIILIGDYTYSNIEILKQKENIQLLGEKKYLDLPQYLGKFDVCIIPFDATIELIKATNPVKFYEYLSAGKKIVATEIPELMPYKGQYVYLANENNKFLNYLELCVSGNDQLASVEQRLTFAEQQDWSIRANTFEISIQSTYKLVSIVIITYNNISYTKECIQSILTKTGYPNYEIIIVDNASTDETPQYLEELAKKHQHIQIILNTENEGFAKGNNIGLRHCNGDYLILLNNDTVVTKGWLTGLIKHLNNNQEIGLIGPVTNSIGNEAKINIEYATIGEMDTVAKAYTEKHINELYRDIHVLAMFCIAMTRKVFNEVGYLDESYGIGMFEDDDYSYRMHGKGYDVACAEDVFIHHYGSASFKKLEDKKYRKIFEENKAKFETKWNTKWIPHHYREGVNE